MIDDFAKRYLHDDLREAREAVLAKLDGLDEYSVRRPLTATGTNLLGLVKHLALWETRYLGEVFGRPFPEPLPRWDDLETRGRDFWASPEETRAEIVDRYHRAAEHSDATIDALAIDAPGHVPWWPRPDVLLFNVMVHVLTETSRHAGHADILREQLDGATSAPSRDAEFWAARHAEIERAAATARQGGRSRSPGVACVRAIALRGQPDPVVNILSVYGKYRHRKGFPLMTTRPSVRSTVTALAVTGAAVFATAGTAAAMPTDFRCTASQVDTTLVAGSPGAGQRYASVQFTAKPGETCTLQGALPVALTGADGVTVTPDPAAADAPSVTVAEGAPASMLLHWTGIEAPENQVQPASVTVTAPQTTTPRGDVSDPAITLPWNQGPLDASADAHGLTVGPVTAGPAVP